jgi:hypothetical protein
MNMIVEECIGVTRERKEKKKIQIIKLKVDKGAR